MTWLLLATLLTQDMGGCDPAQMGCPMPDCPDMAEWMQACEDDMDCAMEEWMESMQAEMEQECAEYSDCPFGEGMEGCDPSWVDQCGD